MVPAPPTVSSVNLTQDPVCRSGCCTSLIHTPRAAAWLVHAPTMEQSSPHLEEVKAASLFASYSLCPDREYLLPRMEHGNVIK